MFYAPFMVKPRRKRPNRVAKAFRLGVQSDRDLRHFAKVFTRNDPTGRVWTQTDVVERALVLATQRWRAGATPWSTEHSDGYPAAVAPPSSATD